MNTSWRHLKYRRLLLPYLDSALDPTVARRMDAHVNECERCQGALAKLQKNRMLLQQAKKLPEPDSEKIWVAIHDRLANQSREIRLHQIAKRRSRLRYAAYALVISCLPVLFLFRADFVQLIKGSATQPSPPTHAALDYGLLLDELESANPGAKFFTQYMALPVSAQEVTEIMPYAIAGLESLPDSYELKSMSLLCGTGCKFVNFSCRKAGAMVMIFQHPLGYPWTFGKYPVVRERIGNVECLRIASTDFCAVSWQGENCEYLAIGKIAFEEIKDLLTLLP